MKKKTPHTGEEAFATAPDHSLKARIGMNVSLNEVFSKDVIAAAQQMVEDAKDSFFIDAKPELDLLATSLASAKADPEHAHHHHMQIIQSAGAICGMAKTFGFTLVMQLSRQVMELSETTDHHLSPQLHALLTKLNDALHLAFSQRIRDDGGEVGRALLDSIKHFTNKPQP